AVSEELAISVRGLRKAYQDTVAVDGVDLDVRRGEIFALLGPNGAGKTTTVEILEGFRERGGGELRVLACATASRTPAWRAKVNIVLHGPGECEELTVGEVVRHFARFYPHADDPAGVIDWVGLAARTRSRTRSLSGGQER